MGQLPAGRVRHNPNPTYGSVDDPNDTTAKEAAIEYDNWVIEILPFIEMGALYDKFDHTKPISTNAITTNATGGTLCNAQARAVLLPFMLCPTDTYNRRPFNGTKGNESSAFGDNWARGNYGVNGGIGLMRINARRPGAPLPERRADVARLAGPGDSRRLRRQLRRPHGRRHRRIDQHHPPRRTPPGVTEYDPRGIWAMGNAPASSIFGCGGCVNDDNGPNCNGPWADNCMNCAQVQAAFGDSSGINLAAAGMSCYGGSSPPTANDQQTARSMHQSGVNVCLCDGSARWISDFIQVFPSSLGPVGNPPTTYQANYSVWDRLIASGDGQPVPADAF